MTFEQLVEQDMGEQLDGQPGTEFLEDEETAVGFHGLLVRDRPVRDLAQSLSEADAIAASILRDRVKLPLGNESFAARPTHLIRAGLAAREPTDELVCLARRIRQHPQRRRLVHNWKVRTARL